jgi:photosystem II stability/assembly factor-like uncharacterized protein
MNGPYGGNLGDIVFTSDGQIFVSAFYSEGKGIYKSTDNGLNWQLLPPIYGYNEFFALGISRDDILFAGSNGAGIFRSTDRGDSWEKLTTYTSYECWAIEFNDSGYVFAGDGDWGGLYKSTNNGDNWQQILPNTVQPISLEIDSNQVIYVGTYTDLLKSTDNGISFTSIYSGLPNVEISTIQTNQQNELFVGTGYTSAGNGIYFSDDGGMNWHQRGLQGQIVYSITIDKNENLYAGTQQNGVYKSTNNGVDWEPIDDGLNNYNIFRVKMSPSDLLFACSETDGGIHRSTDFGNSWEITGVSAGTVFSACFDDLNNIFTSTIGGIQKFNSSNQKWSFLNMGWMIDIVLKDVDTLFACSYGSILLSMNGGTSWSDITPAGSTGLQIRDMELYSDKSILLGTNDFIKRSTDNGNTWITINNGLLRNWIYNLAINEEGSIFATTTNSLYKSDSIDGQFIILKDSVNIPWGNGIATGKSGLVIYTCDEGIFRSTQYGNNWAQISEHSAYSVSIFEGDYVVAGLREGQGMLFSSDKGDSWINLSEGLPSNSSVTWTSIDHLGFLYAGFSGRSLFKSVSEVTSVVRKSMFPEVNFVLSQNYPNPFNPTTSISYQIKERGLVQLRVYNILGKEVVTLVKEEQTQGYYSAKFNGSNLPSGVYFYQLKAGEFIQTKKMILIK